MSFFDGAAPTYTFRLQIEGGNQVVLNTAITARATASEIAKAKNTIRMLLDEHAKALPETQRTDPGPEKKPVGVRGMLHLHCPECGDTFGVFLREFRSEVVCHCGHHIDLSAQLVRYRFTCPHCQSECWGKTNLDDLDITVFCRCGGDVGLRWVPGIEEYQN